MAQPDARSAHFILLDKDDTRLFESLLDALDALRSSGDFIDRGFDPSKGGNADPGALCELDLPTGSGE